MVSSDVGVQIRRIDEFSVARTFVKHLVVERKNSVAMSLQLVSKGFTRYVWLNRETISLGCFEANVILLYVCMCVNLNWRRNGNVLGGNPFDLMLFLILCVIDIVTRYLVSKLLDIAHQINSNMILDCPKRTELTIYKSERVPPTNYIETCMCRVDYFKLSHRL